MLVVLELEGKKEVISSSTIGSKGGVSHITKKNELTLAYMWAYRRRGVQGARVEVGGGGKVASVSWMLLFFPSLPLIVDQCK